MSAYVFMLMIGFLIWQRPDSRLKIIFCDVGQGDAALIIKGDFQVLVDTGPRNGGVSSCLGKYLPFWDRKIEVLINSHPEADHLGDLAVVASRYQIKMLVTDGKAPTREELGNEIKKLVDRGTKLKIAQAGDTIRYGDLQFDVIWPVEKPERPMIREKSLNPFVLVVKLKYGRLRGLFTGDISQVEEEKLLDRGQLEAVQFLKVAHHGSKFSSSREFLEKIAPKLAVISVGKNTYGHPTAEALVRLKEVGAKILRTDQMGDVEIVSDGINVYY